MMCWMRMGVRMCVFEFAPSPNQATNHSAPRTNERAGESRTEELKAKYQTNVQHNLAKFTLLDDTEVCAPRHAWV